MQASVIAAFFSFVVIFLCVLIVFFFKGKTDEQKKAERILSKVHFLAKNASKSSSAKNDFVIEKSEVSLKNLLVKKFKPKIESQLGAKVNIIDFNAKGDSFLALVELSDVRVILSLDSSGKIVDYRKVKRE